MRYRQEKINANDFLRELTVKKDVKASIVSELCGFSKNTLGRYINQETVPNLENFEVFLDYFGYELVVMEKPRGLDGRAREAKEKGISYGELQSRSLQRQWK